MAVMLERHKLHSHAGASDEGRLFVASCLSCFFLFFLNLKTGTSSFTEGFMITYESQPFYKNANYNIQLITENN